MSQQEQLNKILDLETKIREKQTSVLSAHTLLPLGLVLGLGTSVFFFGVTFQRLNSLESGYFELKNTVKEELAGLRTDLKSLSAQINNVEGLLLSTKNK